MVSRLQPQEHVSTQATRAGLRMVLFDGICSQILGALDGTVHGSETPA